MLLNKAKFPAVVVIFPVFAHIHRRSFNYELSVFQEEGFLPLEVPLSE